MNARCGCAEEKITSSLEFRISLSEVTGGEQGEDMGAQQAGESGAVKWSVFLKYGRRRSFGVCSSSAFGSVKQLAGKI